MIYDELLKRCPHISTEGMSHEDWLDNRRKGIGGSDAGAIMGLSNYGSPLTVYLEKKNLVPMSEASRAARRGKFLEPMIMAETMKDFPQLEIVPVPFMFTGPENPFMSANLDGIVFVKEPVEIRGEAIEGLGGFESKTAKTRYGWSETEIPDSYFAQVQHYIAVTGLDWFLVPVYILDDETLNYYVIRRNGDFVTRLVATERDFWENNIEKSIMPAPLGIDNEEDMITGMFEGVKGAIALGEKEHDLCAEHVLINSQIKELEERKKVITIMLKEAIVNTGKANPEGSSEKKASARAGNYSISWSVFPRSSVDSDALKRDGLYDRYKKVSESGRFVVSGKGA